MALDFSDNMFSLVVMIPFPTVLWDGVQQHQAMRHGSKNIIYIYLKARISDEEFAKGVKALIMVKFFSV